MKFVIPYYKSSFIFGDELEHRIVLSDYKLYNLQLRIGVTTSLPSEATSLKSVWLWRYNFISANSSNFWYSQSEYGANGSAVPSGISEGSYYECDGSSLIPEAYVTSGSEDTFKTALTSIRLSSFNDWYFNPSIPSYPSSAMNRAIIMRFSDNRLWELPTDLYTLNGTSITWNTSHPLIVLLNGCDFVLE